MPNPRNLVAAIEEQERLASVGQLSEERQRALDLYLGKPYGDEQDGRSKVVMRDVADTIEWIKPSLMKVFCSGDEVARFDPVGPEDEEQAQQETDYVNHVIQQRNNGFLMFYDWFHDALLQKTGYVWMRPCEERVANREQYKGLSDDEFASIVQGDEVEVLQHTEYPGPEGMTYHDAVVRKAKTYSYLKASNIPPERALVAPDWPSLTLKGCPFFEIIDWKTISELRQEGYDVPDDIDDTALTDDEWEEQGRSTTGDNRDREDIEADPATRRVKVRYIWMQRDEDGDGIAEQRHIVICGTRLLSNEEDDLTPVACLSPIRMPHEHVGLSIADIVEDLQRIRTVLVRGFLDNTYLANNGQYAVDVNRVNLDDWLTARPGGIKRIDGPVGDAWAPLVHPQVGGDILAAVEYVDTVRENRTGVTRYNQGMDADSLNKTATGVNIIANAAAQRIELIARLFAETGVRDLMLITQAMSIKHGRQAEMVKLRGKWVQVDPRTWANRRDMTVAVGLGNGNKDQMIQHLMLIAQMQAQGLPIGIATKTNIYNTAKRFTQNVGFKNADEFWTDPEQNPQPSPPNPDVIKAELDAKAKQQDMQVKEHVAQMDIQHRERIAQIEEHMKLLDLQIAEKKAGLEQQQMGMKAQEAQAQSQIRMRETEHKAAHEPEGDKRVDQVLQMLEELIGSQTVGFERDEAGRATGIKRRNGSVTQILRDAAGRIEALQ